MSYTVYFENVGRSNSSFEKEFDHFPTENDLVMSVRHLLVSRVVSVETTENEGIIFVGGWRAIGTYTIKEKPAHADETETSLSI